MTVIRGSVSPVCYKSSFIQPYGLCLETLMRERKKLNEWHRFVFDLQELTSRLLQIDSLQA